jgi:hypothetical protein
LNDFSLILIMIEGSLADEGRSSSPAAKRQSDKSFSILLIVG